MHACAHVVSDYGISGDCKTTALGRFLLGTLLLFLGLFDRLIELAHGEGIVHHRGAVGLH